MKRILVALDASPRAAMILAEAARLAKLTNSTLVLYRAISIPADLPSELYGVTDRSVEDVLMGNAIAGLDRLAAAVPEARIETTTATFAIPWDGICRAAHEHGVDLVIIGSHDYHGLDRVLGTTAAKVVNHVDRNVLVVRSPL
jgi:nucleotide-binding universal stress UspA family protein